MEQDEELSYEKFLRAMKSSMRIEMVLKGLFIVKKPFQN